MKKWLIGLACAGLFATAAMGQLVISQYYEGASNDKWIEIYNPGPGAVDLAGGGYRLGLWANVANREGWKTGVAPNAQTNLSGSLAAGGTFLVKHGSAALPAYATADLMSSTVANFNGDDSLVLYTGATFAFENVVDAFGMIGSNALNRSFVRKNTITAGVNTDFDAGDWDEFTNAQVDGAAESTNERLGYHNTGEEPPPATTNVRFHATSAAVSENQGTYQVTVSKTLAEGDVSGQIVLSGSATVGGGADYTVDTTNFTLNGATTSAVITVTINDDEDEEGAETIVMDFANLVGAGTTAPATFTLTINASDMGEPSIWLNELNYDPVGTDDAGTEWLEVAGPAGVDLSAFVVVLYNGSGGAPYNTTALSGTIDDEGCGYGAVDLVYGVANSLQNGAPDGVALAQVSGGITSLVQFLSYEGVFTGVGGPADGVESVNVGTQAGTSENTLQLGGTATDYSGFVWETNTPSRGSLNANQSITGCTPVPLTNVMFTASAASVDENAGTYEVTVIKNRPEGDVSGEIVLSGSATPGDDYTINATNFTLNGAVTSATFTVTIVDDDENEPAETVVLTLANVVNGTIATPSVFTLTIGVSDVPAEGIVDFRFNNVPYLQVTAKDGNLAVSDMALTAGSIETAILTGDYFTDEPYIEESTGWTATSQAEAKAFLFTITPAEGSSITIDGISFNAYATAAGPSAFGFDIGGGTSSFEVNAPSAVLLSVSQAVVGVENATGAIEVKIQGWLNGSRESTGSGVFRLDDVVIHGTVYSGPPVFSVSLDKSNGFTVNEGSTATIVATAANGEAPYTWEWTTDLPVGTYNAPGGAEPGGKSFFIQNNAPTGTYYATATATDNTSATAQKTVTFSVVGLPVGEPAVIISGNLSGTVGVQMNLAISITNETATDWFIDLVDPDALADTTYGFDGSTFTLTPAKAGTYVLTATAQTSGGNVSNTVNLVISGGGGEEVWSIGDGSTGGTMFYATSNRNIIIILPTNYTLNAVYGTDSSATGLNNLGQGLGNPLTQDLDYTWTPATRMVSIMSGATNRRVLRIGATPQ